MISFGSPFVRRAGLSDSEPAWHLIAACRAELARQDVAQWDEVYPNEAMVADDVARGHLFVLVQGERCVATVTLNAVADPAYAGVPWESPGPALIVHRLCVDPRSQGHGFGRRLMEFAERHAISEGFASIRLDAYSGNSAALALYRSRGYRQAGELYFPRRALPFYLFERTMSELSDRPLTSAATDG